ncbi:ComEC/Rec2 family competence protein [Williamsia sp. Leaf354]|uniref:ComEC/Rec2 family competence protein n=1 Tax=Williamsia sp. Leaf354 TaxID=1736349 RepID=UPI0009EB87F2|nr:ComEC/Rec2 family competence protein [Williamsia sp. Leaf354]
MTTDSDRSSSPETAPAVTDLRLIAPAVGCWAVTVIGVVAAPVVTGSVAAVCGIVAGVGAVAVRRGGLRPAVAEVVLILVATAGITAGFGTAITIRATYVAASPMAAPELLGHKVTAVMTVVDDARTLRGPGPPRVRIAVRAAPVRSGGAPVAATLTAPQDGWADLVPGQRAVAVVAVDRPYRSDLTAAALRTTTPPRAVAPPPRHQIWATGVRTRLASLARRQLPAAESGLLPGLAVGDTEGMPDEVADEFRTAGLTHLLAVSGANFAIIAGAVLLVLRVCGTPRIPAAFLTMAVLGCFVVVVRPSPSVVRAALMGLVGLIALVAERRTAAVPALAVAVLGVLIIWPAMAVDPGFALSVAATAGLIALAPPIRTWLCDRGCPRVLAEVLAVAVAAQIVTIPLVVMIAGSIGPVGVLANIAVAPAVPLITVLGTLAAAVAGVSTVAAAVLIRLCEPSLWWMVRVADVAAHVPGATIAVPDGVGGAALAAVVVLVVVLAVRSVARAVSRSARGSPPGERRWSPVRCSSRVAAVWQHDRRERPTTPAAGRRRLPGRTRDGCRPRRGDRRGRGRRPPGDPRARG